jgi:Ferritin-like domain
LVIRRNHPTGQELDHVTASITRGQFLSGSAKGGAALLVTGATLGALAGEAAAALPPTDTAYVRLLVGAELLAADFYTQAINASITGNVVTKYLKLAFFNEQQHYQSVAGILTGEGVTPAVANDITFAYPSGAFESEQSIIALAIQIETTMVGAYLGAMSQVQTTALLTGLAQIAANEAQHQSYFTAVSGGKSFALSFPPALTITEASNALAAYSS